MSFFVTVKDAGRVGYLAGPFRTHGEALAKVERARELAETVPGADWRWVDDDDGEWITEVAT